MSALPSLDDSSYATALKNAALGPNPTPKAWQRFVDNLEKSQASTVMADPTAAEEARIQTHSYMQLIPELAERRWESLNPSNKAPAPVDEDRMTSKLDRLLRQYGLCLQLVISYLDFWEFYSVRYILHDEGYWTCLVERAYADMEWARCVRREVKYACTEIFITDALVRRDTSRLFEVFLVDYLTQEHMKPSFGSAAQKSLIQEFGADEDVAAPHILLHIVYALVHTSVKKWVRVHLENCPAVAQLTAAMSKTTVYSCEDGKFRWVNQTKRYTLWDIRTLLVDILRQGATILLPVGTRLKFSSDAKPLRPQYDKVNFWTMDE